MTFRFLSCLHKNKIVLLIPFLLITLLYFTSCTPSAKFASREEIRFAESGNVIRVLLDEAEKNFVYTVNDPLVIRDAKEKIAVVKQGNVLIFTPDGESITLSIRHKKFKSDYFLIESENDPAAAKFKGKGYTGIIKILSSGNKVEVINTLSLEEYIKGVMPFEMPIGKGERYFESFKAFAICVRTYAINKIKEGKSLFDIYADTRDQVYGGAGKGNALSDNAVDMTKGMILSYNNQPAVIYYHSTCGGMTEKADYVFDTKDIPYLRGVKDGENCIESPRFTWKESYTSELFVDRLFKGKMIQDNNYTLKDLKIISRFESGRVNKLEVTLNDKNNKPHIVNLFGNAMRWVIRTGDNSTILRSTAFNISFDGSTVIIEGKGYGHGVGLCQWGAMHLSFNGETYKEILSHYYPGTSITSIDD